MTKIENSSHMQLLKSKKIIKVILLFINTWLLKVKKTLLFKDINFLIILYIGKIKARILSHLLNFRIVGHFSKAVFVSDLDLQCATSLACPQDSRPTLPHFALLGRNWIKLVYI